MFTYFKCKSMVATAKKKSLVSAWYMEQIDICKVSYERGQYYFAIFL